MGYQKILKGFGFHILIRYLCRASFSGDNTFAVNPILLLRVVLIHTCPMLLMFKSSNDIFAYTHFVMYEANNTVLYMFGATERLTRRWVNTLSYSEIATIMDQKPWLKALKYMCKLNIRKLNTMLQNRPDHFKLC
jgi:hypothetical protein